MKNSKSFMKSSEVKFRKMIKPIILAFSLILIVFLADQQALGFTNESDQEEYLDFQPYTGNRIMIFNDTRIDYCVTNNSQNPGFNHIAANAIKTWHDRIVEVTNHPLVWDMTMHIQPQDPSVCDGFLNYVHTPNPTIFQLSGVAGFSHPLTPVANVTIYTDDYQSTLLNMAEKDENFWENMTLEKFSDIVNHSQTF